MFYILCGIQLVASAGHVALVLCGHVETSVSPNDKAAHAGAEQSVWEGGPPVVSYSSDVIKVWYAFLIALVVRYRRMDDSL